MAVVGARCAVPRSLPAAVCESAAATGGCATATALAPARPDAIETSEASRAIEAAGGILRLRKIYARLCGAFCGDDSRCQSPSTAARPKAWVAGACASRHVPWNCHACAMNCHEIAMPKP